MAAKGLFTLVVLCETFYHSNSLVKRECGKQARRSHIALFFEFVGTTSSILLVHFFIGHDKLLPNAVTLTSGNTEAITFWALLWFVIVTDLVVKIITVDVKILVTAMPGVVLSYQKRGKVYLFIESVSQLYRSLLPIQHWLYYLMRFSESHKKTGMVLAAWYVLDKIAMVCSRIKLFKNATAFLLTSVMSIIHATYPTDEQLRSAGQNCPICQDNFSTPVRILCGHMFCELCICAWLDHEHTCPLCRATVAKEPIWRDGATAQYLILF